MRGTLVRVAVLGLLVAGCSPAVLGQTDDFGQRLDQGCSDRRSCDDLVSAARARKQTCSPNTIGRIRCGDAQADLARAMDLRQDVLRREERAAEEAVALERARRAEAREAEELNRTRDEEKKALAKENAAWLILDLDGCAVRGNPQACWPIERFITDYPESSHIQEAADKLRAGRAVIAETERRVAEEAAAEAERPRKTGSSGRESPAPSSGEGGRVCCCDGTVSPTCTTVKRGCCSHHGGVCSCQ